MVIATCLTASAPVAVDAAEVRATPIGRDATALGDEVAVAIDRTNARVVALFDPADGSGRAWSSDVSGAFAPLAWTAATLPGTTGLAPFDPWAAPGNVDGQLFVSMSVPSPVARARVFQSTDGGLTWGSAAFYEAAGSKFQDRPAIDVDRAERGDGGVIVPSPHDGEIFLAFDELSDDTPRKYEGSLLHILSPGGALRSELVIPSNETDGIGNGFQPVAGIDDGRVHLVGRQYSGSDVVHHFRVLKLPTDAPASATSSVIVDANAPRITLPQPGHRLDGTTQHRGFNGHRIGGWGVLAIDRTRTRRRGTLYFLAPRRPGQGSNAQAELVLFERAPGGSTWSAGTVVPDAQGTSNVSGSRFFPMMAVDEDGIVHIAYYENAGVPDCGAQGVTFPCIAEVYYRTFDPTVGANGWRTAVKVSQKAAGSPDTDEPRAVYTAAAIALSRDRDYRLLGDYHQLAVAGRGATQRVVVCWTALSEEAGVPAPRPWCAVVDRPACGDGKLTTSSGEVCDDANDRDDDCCTGRCEPRAVGASCAASSTCAPRARCDRTATGQPVCRADCYYDVDEILAGVERGVECSSPDETCTPGSACSPLGCSDRKVVRFLGRATALLTGIGTDARLLDRKARRGRDRRLKKALRVIARAEARALRSASGCQEADRSALATLRDRAICALYGPAPTTIVTTTTTSSTTTTVAAGF